MKTELTPFSFPVIFPVYFRRPARSDAEMTDTDIITIRAIPAPNGIPYRKHTVLMPIHKHVVTTNNATKNNSRIRKSRSILQQSNCKYHDRRTLGQDTNPTLITAAKSKA